MSTTAIDRPFSPTRRPPFVFPWRFIRPLWQARNGDFRGVMRVVETLGDACRTHVGLYWMVFLNDPALVEELFVGASKHYHKDPTYIALRSILGNGLINSEDAFHLRQRRMMQPAFHKARIDEYAACMVRYARERSALWRDGESFDMMQEMMATTLSVISKTMFNAAVNDDTEQVYHALNTVLGSIEVYGTRLTGAIFDRLPIAASRRVRAARATLDSIVYRFIREHREAGEDTGDLLSMLLMAQAEDGSGSMSDQQLRDECITLFLAGHETTSLALSWTFYLLSLNPEVAERMHEEIDRVLEGGRDATAADMTRLDYTRRVFTEAMRLYPPVMGVGRQAIRDNVIGPYLIRKGDVILVANYVSQHQSRWFPDPERFDPDRWLPERCAHLPKFVYFPFGGGVRKCIGEPFAWMEGVLILATCAQHWRFELAPDARIVADPKITLRPKYGVKMIPHRRADR